MTELDTNKAASRRLYEEVFGRGNFEVADEIMANDAVSHGPGAPPNFGREQIKRQARVLRGAFPDFVVTLNDQLADGNRVCSRWTARGTHTADLILPPPMGTLPASGMPITFDEIRIDRYEGGRIVESWFIPDRFTMWNSLGLIAAPKGRATDGATSSSVQKRQI